MQNYVQSSLLKNYITQNTQTAPIKQQRYAEPVAVPVQEEKQTGKKAKIAKAALFSALVLSASAAALAIFRHKGGVVNSFKDLGNSVKKFFTGDGANNVVDGVKKKAGDLNEYQAGADNIINVKDSITRHFLSRIPGYKKFDEFTANIYKKACKNSVNKGYQKSIKAGREAIDSVAEALKNGDLDEQSANSLIELLNKKLDGVIDFAKGVNNRFNEVDESFKGLDKDTWETINGLRGEGIIEKTKQYFKKSVVDGRLNNAKALQKAAIDSDINKAFSADDIAALEELLSGIKNEKVVKKIAGAGKAFEKAKTKECLDMFNKLRDINCGSAATDIMSAAGTAGLLGIYTAQADTKEEKVGVTLTTGIPLIVSLGTVLTATVNMISGGKTLGLGVLTGFLASRLGSGINDSYQKSKGIENPKKTIVTMDDYGEAVRSKLILNG